MEKLVLVDGNSLINRAFYALPILTNSSGEYCNALYGFCNLIIKVIQTEKPDYMAICFDAGKHTFRHDIYAEYKGTRKGMPEELAEQIPNMKKLLKAMNIFVIEKQNIEADDLVGSLAKKFNTQNIIFSGDKDLLQLIDENTEVHLTKKGVTDLQVMNEKTLLENMNLKPYQIIELKALMGDTSDNIPGVLGIGEKTALSLLEKYDNIENLYDHILEINGKLYEKLFSGKDSAFMSKTLATINTKVDLDIKLEDLKYDFPFDKNVLDLFKHYEFNSLLKRKDIFKEETAQIIENKTVVENIDNVSQIDNVIEEIKNTKLFSIIIDTNIHLSLSKYKEIVIFCNSQNMLTGINFSDVVYKLKEVLEDESIKKICLDIKKIKHIMHDLRVDFNGAIFDVSIANYILSGSKKGSEDISNYLSKLSYDDNSKASCLFECYEKYLKELKDENLDGLYYSIDFPLIDVLFNMEVNGFKLDKDMLLKLYKEYDDEIKKLNEEIINLAGEEFNVNSPKQVQDILTKLNILPKNANSTKVGILEKLKDENPIIDKILRYRKINKFNSTYLADFIKMLDNDNIIHTEFKQALTSTGRLSSVEPNLQNIPIRDDEGKGMRKMFISRFENGSIISADYSQIELRLLAHYSQDEKLIDAYNNDYDIHSKTASDIFNVPFNEITDKQRRTAKAVNFGIIYGISDYGLSQNLNIAPKEAKLYIQKYFETYPKVKEYMNASVEKVKSCGYATTLFGRKRKIDEINSSNFMIRQFGERASMNMPLQGTASDLIKNAMIKVDKAIKDNNLKSKLILQIHDELIVDTFPGEEEIIKKILKENMENAMKLNVRLKVEISMGKTWFEAK
ncbi:MAG: DNA polymerase I [Clostridiales bacterium]|nr:DNA polymerase I [Candidatus Apopatousia equi]